MKDLESQDAERQRWRGGTLAKMPRFVGGATSLTANRPLLIGLTLRRSFRGRFDQTDTFLRLCLYRSAYWCHPETLPVLLWSRIVLPYRAVRKHLGAVGE
jgi:hypothetical protein